MDHLNTGIYLDALELVGMMTVNGLVFFFVILLQSSRSQITRLIDQNTTTGGFRIWLLRFALYDVHDDNYEQCSFRSKAKDADTNKARIFIFFCEFISKEKKGILGLEEKRSVEEGWEKEKHPPRLYLPFDEK